MSPETAQDCERQSKGGEGHLVHLIDCFDCYSDILESLPLSGERNSSVIFSKASQPNE